MGGRVVDCARLESVCSLTGTRGSVARAKHLLPAKPHLQRHRRSRCNPSLRLPFLPRPLHLTAKSHDSRTKLSVFTQASVANFTRTRYVENPFFKDGWQSGRLRTLGKRVFLNRNPGFESLPIRKPDSQLLA